MEPAFNNKKKYSWPFNSNQICPLCGVRKAKHDGKKYIEEEHVPAIGMFPKELRYLERDVFIKVPSCGECNIGTSDLDLEFQVNMSIYVGLDSEPKKIFWQSVLNSLKHPINKKYKNKLVASCNTSLYVPLKGELYHPVKFNALPMSVSVKKIVRGLHWRRTGIVLPYGTKIEVHLMKQKDGFSSNIIEYAKYCKESVVKCQGLFEAYYGITEDKSYASMWFLRFYGEDCFIVFVMPSKKQRQKLGLEIARQN